MFRTVLFVFAVLLLSGSLPAQEKPPLDECLVLQKAAMDSLLLLPSSFEECVAMGGPVGTLHDGRVTCRFGCSPPDSAYEACVKRGGSVTVGCDPIGGHTSYDCTLTFFAAYDMECLRMNLASPEAKGRRTAAVLLGSLGKLSAPAAPDLVTCLGDENEEVRLAASRTLSKIGGSATPYVIDAMSSPDVRVRRGAIHPLATLGWDGDQGEEILSTFHHALADEDQKIREEAALQIGYRGTKDQREDAVPILGKMLYVPWPGGYYNRNDSSELLRWNTARALCSFDSGIEALLRALDSPRHEVNITAALLLPDTLQGPRMKARIRALVEGLGRTEDPWSHDCWTRLKNLNSGLLRGILKKDLEVFVPELKKAAAEAKSTDARAFARDLLYVLEND